MNLPKGTDGHSDEWNWEQWAMGGVGQNEAQETVLWLWSQHEKEH